MNKNKLWKFVIYLTVFGLFLIFSLHGLDQVPFQGDESARIYSSDTYEAFINFDLGSPVWQESYWTLTQPPVSRYFIGLGRSLGGYHTNFLAASYDHFLTKEENIQRGAIPETRLLWFCRLPMALLLSFTFLILFYLVELGFGRLSAVIFVGFSLLNTYLFFILPLALGESPLLFFTTLAILFSTFGFRAWTNHELSYSNRVKKLIFWFVLMSIASGLAAGSKLNGGLAVFGGIIFFIYTGIKEKGKRTKQLFYWIMPFMISVLSFGTFILINPYLYTKPLARALGMFMFRNYEMNIQQTTFTTFQISGIWQHLYIDVINVFQNYATINFQGAWILNLVLFLIGLAIMIRKWKGNFSTNPAVLSILIIGIAVSLPSLLTPLDYSRYFMFPVVFSMILIALAISNGVFQLFSIWKLRNKGFSQ